MMDMGIWAYGNEISQDSTISTSVLSQKGLRNATKWFSYSNTLKIKTLFNKMGDL